MNLLVVDDQYRVVEGIINGVNWKGLNIDHVFSALNVFQAKDILKQNQVDIVLCDIEMPMENGLELIGWIKRQNLPAQCIVLTAHADFGYAQDAVKLGCFDYILQPASYHTIEECIRRAIQKVYDSEKKEELENLGIAFKQQEKNIVRNAFRNYTTGAYTKKQLESLHQLGKIPSLDQEVYLVMVELLRWNDSETWDQKLLSDTMENIAGEVFETYGQKVAAVPVLYPRFAMFIWGEKLLDMETMFCQLQFINSVCQQFMKCEAAVYIKNPVKLEQVREQWDHLELLREDNVAMTSGVYVVKREKQEFVYRLPEIRRWSELLKDGYAKAVEEESCHFLDNLAASGMINRKVLREFYQDFLQVAYHAAEAGDGFLRELFSTQEEFQIYMDGMRSVDQMKRLIRYIVSRFDNGDHNDKPENLVEKTVNYILDHLEEDIRRDDLADHVHLHPDYLTRIFKKETGMTLKEFVIQTKMKEAQMLLRTTRLPVSIVSAKVGYNNFSHFSYTYKKIMGVTPQEERQKAQREEYEEG